MANWPDQAAWPHSGARLDMSSSGETRAPRPPPFPDPLPSQPPPFTLLPLSSPSQSSFSSAEGDLAWFVRWPSFKPTCIPNTVHPEKPFSWFNAFNTVPTQKNDFTIPKKYFFWNFNEILLLGRNTLHSKTSLFERKKFVSLPLREFPCHDEDFDGTGTKFFLSNFNDICVAWTKFSWLKN